MHPVWSCVAHVIGTGVVSVPSGDTFTICEEIGPHVPPACSVNVPRYVAPFVAHGFAFSGWADELPPPDELHATANVHTTHTPIDVLIKPEGHQTPGPSSTDDGPDYDNT